LSASERENVLTDKWNPACNHPVIAAKYAKEMRDGAVRPFPNVKRPTKRQRD
jgi:hypothetical protein